MNYIHTVFLGIVEGLTEFLPISSTYHLIATSKLLGLPETEFLSLFQVVIQTGAILAVLTLFGRELLKNKDLVVKLLYSFIPTAIIGFLLHKSIKGLFEAFQVTTLVFIAVGVLFILLEQFVFKKPFKKHLAQLTNNQAALVGLLQACAVVPGVSRAGAVIVGMMLLGFNRADAAKYSFLLALPTITAAGALDLWKGREILATNAHLVPHLIVGSVVAYIAAYCSIRWFVGYVQKSTLTPFGWYRIVVGLILLYLFVLGSTL